MNEDLEKMREWAKDKAENMKLMSMKKQMCKLPFFFLDCVLTYNIFLSLLVIGNTILSTVSFSSFFNMCYSFRHIFVLSLFLPLYLQTYIFNREKMRVILNFLSWIMIIMAFLFLTYLSFNVILNIPFKTIIDLDWSYPATIEWTLATLISFSLFHRKNHQPFQSLTLALLTMSSAGLLYEIPIFLALNIGRLSVKFLTPFMLVFALYNLEWKPNKIFYLALIIYVNFSITYFFVRGIWSSWIPRLPTIFLMLTIPLSFKTKGGDKKRLMYF